MLSYIRMVIIFPSKRVYLANMIYLLRIFYGIYNNAMY